MKFKIAMHWPNLKFSEFTFIKMNVLDKLLLYMTIGAFPLLATSLLIFYSSGWKPSMILDTVGLISIPIIYFLKRRLSYNFKSAYLIILGYSAAIMVLLDYSFFGTGIIILSSITLISTLFFGKKVGWILMVMNLFTIATVGVLYQFNYLTYSFDLEKYIHSSYTWIDHSATFLFFIGIVVVASGQIHDALLKLIRQANRDKEKFEKLFNNIQDAILIYTTDGKVLEINNSLLEMYGVKRTSVYDIKAEEFAIENREELFRENSISENLKYQYETKAKRFDSQQEFFVEVMLSPIEYGNEKAILANIRNITGRRVAEEALKESEEKYRSLIESSPAGIFIIRSERFIYVNPAGIRVLGFNSLDEIAGKYVYSFVAPEFKKIAEKRLERASDIDINESLELKLYRRDGSELWAEIISLPFKFYGSHAVLVMGFDVTKRKKIEKLLIQKNTEIEKTNFEFALLNKQLKIAKEKAEESDRLKSAFLSNMSHEIRTPMNAILGFSDLLIKATLTEQKKLEYIEIINSSGIQLLSLINDIIDISKIESNQITIDTSTLLNIGDVFKHLSVIHGAKAKNNNIRLDYYVDLLPTQCLVFLDEIRLRQILVNLIGNALKFTPNGYIWYGVSLEDTHLLFTVEDSGIGIEPQLQSVIFERFRQADGSTTRDYGGTGLGLAISKALVELMGGKIWLSSMPGKGTTFYFTLPFVTHNSVIPVKEETSLIEINNPAWHNRTILLVEDEEVNILFIQEILQPTGVNLLVARNASQTYEKIKASEKVDIVLLDIKIPEVDGYKIMKVLKKNHPGLPVIAQTAYALAEERKKILDSGFDDYISKPISKPGLYSIIARYLDMG